MPTTATTQSRIARLADGAGDDYPHVVHGVAHGENELTFGLNGPKYWPAAELRKAADTLEGRSVYRTHEDGSREEVGAVLRAAYQPGLGVVYEAGLEADDVAEDLASGKREVSIEAGNPAAVDRHEETGAAILRDYEYTGLATPESGPDEPGGASEGNYTAPGSADGNPAIAALSGADIPDVLDGEAALNAYRSVAGVRFRGTRDGKLSKDALPNTDGDYEQHYLFDAETASASSYPVVDAEGYLRRGNVAAAYSVGPRGNVGREELYEKLRSLNDAFTTPPIEPEKLETEDASLTRNDLAADAGAVLAAARDIPTPDDAPDGVEVLGNATSDTSMTDPDDPDDPDVEALLERVDEKDEQIDDLQAELEDKEERIDDLDDEVETAKRAYAARLAEHSSVLDEDDYVERFEIAELREKFEDLDESLTDEPEPDVQSGGGSGDGAGGEALLQGLDDSEREQVESDLETIAELEGKDGVLQKEREVRAERVAELTGEDPETILDSDN